MAILESLNSRGVTIIMVTHNPVQGRRAKRVIELQYGRILKDSTSVREAANA